MTMYSYPISANIAHYPISQCQYRSNPNCKRWFYPVFIT